MPEDYEPNPWVPMTDPVDCKHLLKLQEELGECMSAAARCQMQGIDEAEPVTRKMNREWLEDEIADVLANIELVIARFGLDQVRIFGRAGKKKDVLRKWHAQAAVPIRPLDPELQAELGHHGPKARDRGLHDIGRVWACELCYGVTGVKHLTNYQKCPRCLQPAPPLEAVTQQEPDDHQDQDQTEQA